MNFTPITMTSKTRHSMRLSTLAGIIISLSSCDTQSTFSSSGYSRPSFVPSSESTSSRQASTLNKHSVSTERRQIVKQGKLKLATTEIRQTAQRIETIVLQNGGQISSMAEYESQAKSANYEVYVPAQHLVPTMDQISQLGKVSYRKVSADDVTKATIRFKTKLANLKQRRSRVLALYQSTASIKDKLELESKLAELESDLYDMEESMRQMQRIAHFSKLSISVSQHTIRGPLGIVKDSGLWLFGKLFTIRE